MIKSFILIAVRNLWKNKVLSFINITGLALGMAGAALLILNIQYEVSIDQFHEKKDHIYKAYNNVSVNGRTESWNATPALLAPALKKDYPEIKNVTRLAGTDKLLGYGDKKLKVSGNYADPSFLEMFSFPLVQGAIPSALHDAHSIVLTEQLAKRIFGDENPMNKIIIADNADNFTVTGILKDLPANTEFKFEYLVPWEFLKVKGIERASWKSAYVTTYAELKPAADINVLNKKVADVIKRNASGDTKQQVFLHPLTREHLYSHFENGKEAGGNINNVRFLSILAFVILLIACINFMNLSTARSEKRAKEVGIRKVIGAVKRNLIYQFIGESIVLSAIAGLIALVLVQLALPVFSTLAKTTLTIQYLSVRFWLLALGFILITGILAGSYPAFYLSSFKPVWVLKGVLKNGNALVTPRRILVVLQFVFAIFLINFTIIFQKQIRFSENREPGFAKEKLLYHPLTDDLRKNYRLVKNELIGSGVAIAVSKSNTAITLPGTAVSGLKWTGMAPGANVSFELLSCREDFVKTNGLTLLAGRDINVEQFPTDTASCMINESALKVMRLKKPVGEIIKDEDKNWRIVGVVKDFVMASPNDAISPALILGTDWANFINIRLTNTGSFVQNVKKVETILKKYNPNFITEYRFADEDYASRSEQKKNVASLINSFAFMAIFISCMGLFGLAAYMAEKRTREIGIRKVLGASVTGITSLLAMDFIKLVFIAIIIASPLAWIFMNFYLQQFEYRTTLSFWILIASGAGALFIAVSTVSFQSIKAAISNPVKSLRSE